MFASAASLALLCLAVDALNPVLVRNNVFYDSVTKERLFLYGVDYQPGGEKGIDPLNDPEICARDVFLIQKLGANVVRVYTVDNSMDHNECMSMYNAAGIYILLDVNSGKPNQHLNRNEPWTTYTKAYAEHVFKTITVFSGYDNVIGFFNGNELINSNVSASASPPYLKAITRDMKAYIGAHLDRPLAIGYSAADNIEYRAETATYMSCGTADDGVNDFYAINSYQWCGAQTMHSSGYDTLLDGFRDFPLPLFLSETGCNLVRPRQFGEVDAVLGPAMRDVFSGLLVYEFSEEPNAYGLARVDAADGSIELLADYDALARRYAAVRGLPTTVPAASSSSTGAVRACPDPSTFAAINGSAALPSLPEIRELVRVGVTAVSGRLSPDVRLRATRYKITDARGVELTDKTPQRRSGVRDGASGPNLKALLRDGYTPTGKASATAGASSSSSRAGAGDLSSGGSGKVKSAAGRRAEALDPLVLALSLATTTAAALLLASSSSPLLGGN